MGRSSHPSYNFGSHSNVLFFQLFNDEDLLKYLTDPSDFGAFGVPSNDQQQRQPANQEPSSASAGKYGSTSSSSSNPPAPNNSYRNSSYSSSELASMDDILALLRK